MDERCGSVSFLRDRRGSMPLLFAFMIVPLIGFSGGVIDYGKAVSDRNRLNNALDAAIIVGANKAQSDDGTNATDATIIANAQNAALAAFNATPKLPTGSAATFKATIQNRVVTVNGSYTSSTPTTLLKVLGIQQFPLGASATSAISLSPMVDIHLLVDVSGSMAIGATQADIDKLNAGLGCAFACHDGQKVNNTKYDAFEWAESKKIKLRIDEVNDGITDFIDWLKGQTSSAKRIRIAVYAFSTTLETVTSLTSNLTTAANSLPQAPDTSGDYDGATLFTKIMPPFAKKVGTGGDGITTPKKLVIIATDGVQDPTRTWSTSRPELRPQVTPFAPADCDVLDSSVSVGVLYAPYLKMTWDWGYMATLGQPSQIGNSGTRFDDIVPQLKACATASNLFVDTSTTTSIGDAFVKIFQSFTQVRLAR